MSDKSHTWCTKILYKKPERRGVRFQILICWKKNPWCFESTVFNLITEYSIISDLFRLEFLILNVGCNLTASHGPERGI